VSSHFQQARLAFVDYFPEYFAKSGVLGAAAAHGVAPITLRDACSEQDGLIKNSQYLRLEDLLLQSSDELPRRLAKVSAGIRSWYSGHTLTRHAELLIQARGAAATRTQSPQLAGTQGK
jgi:hypothetical protein